jgi:hypothetical protein
MRSTVNFQRGERSELFRRGQCGRVAGSRRISDQASSAEVAELSLSCEPSRSRDRYMGTELDKVHGGPVFRMRMLWPSPV